MKMGIPKYTYDTVVFIGRFQPMHNAHLKLLGRALQQGKQVIVIIGSAEKPRTFENPWPAAEREEMIRGTVLASELHTEIDRIKFAHNIDTFYSNGAWLIRVQEIVQSFSKPDDKIAIIGHKKPNDESTFYLDMFPQWDKILNEPLEPLNATDIRKIYFQRNQNLKWLANVIPEYVYQYLDDFKETTEFQYILDERDFIIKHNKIWDAAPYTPTFNTGDAVVTAAGHVLMIRRKNAPGKGLLALPGGYLNPTKDASIKDCALRELEEETCIKLQRDTLNRLIVEEKRFDAINRSPRGRIITVAFHVVLDDKKELPKVKGKDDAESAFWIPISEVRSDQCFEDHHEILYYFVGRDV